MSSTTSTAGAERRGRANRIDLLDAARGVALVAMLVYHFTWDLEFFGYLPAGTAQEGGWRLFARGIATSFLFLVGIGLVLAHGRGLRMRPFLKRLIQVAAGALAVTVATLFATPDSFVFFGILHQIAVASVVGLMFVRLPAAVTILTGVAVIALPFFFATDATNPRWLAWFGFAEAEPLSNDLVPVFPWTGIVLLGIAGGRLAERAGIWRRLATVRIERRPATWLTLIGRHSLAFYLLHQPISIGAVALYAQIAPPDLVAAFPENCRRSCMAQEADEAVCVRYCDCVQTQLTDRALLDDLLANRLSPEGESDVRDTVLACSFAPNP